MEEREELWLEGGGVRFAYTDDYVDSLRAKVAELKSSHDALEAKLAKYENLEPVAWVITTEMQDGRMETYPAMGRYKDVKASCDFGEPIPLYALEK